MFEKRRENTYTGLAQHRSGELVPTINGEDIEAGTLVMQAFHKNERIKSLGVMRQGPNHTDLRSDRSQVKGLFHCVACSDDF